MTVKKEKLEIKKLIEEVGNFQRTILTQRHEIEDIKKTGEEKLDSIFKDLLNVLDTFDKANNRLYELYPDSEDVERASKRFATSRKRLCEILIKNDVIEMTFADGIAVLEDCEIKDTEPDANKADNTIIAIEKSGYRRNGRLLRLAEVIVVKN